MVQPAHDALTAFLALSFRDQLLQVAARSVIALRELARLYGEKVKQDGYVTMERQVERCIGERIRGSE